MACKRHNWTAPGVECPECKQDREVVLLMRDAAALACVSPAAKRLLLHSSTFTDEELAAEAYAMADAMLRERQKGEDKLTPKPEYEPHG